MTETVVHRPLFSVIVPVFNDSVGLRRCLEALELQTVPKDLFEVVVVDNGSNPPLAPVVAPFRFARCQVERKPGSYAARNAGARSAIGALIAFTDADCQPAPDWLEQLAKIFKMNTGVGAIGGRIELQISEKRRIAELYELVLPPIPQEQLIERLGFAATANLSVRCSVYRQVGGFNEDLLSSGDREWGERLRAAGHELRYSSQCSVMHPARTTVRALVNRRRRIEGGAVRLATSSRQNEVAAKRGRPYPPRRLLAAELLFEPDRFGLGRAESLKVLVLAGFLVAVRMAERLRLRVGGHPVR